MTIDAMALLSAPLQAGRLVLRNRVVVPAHTTNFARDNLATDRHVAYHAERARGGAGLIITEAIRVHPTSAGRASTLGAFDDGCVAPLRAVTRAVRGHGAAVVAQLVHAGRQAPGDGARVAAWAPSAIAWTPGAHIPHAMSAADIATVVESFADAARRMRAAGFDGIEIHAGHGHLIHQFLSPVSNTRDDDYGGDPQRRLRLLREVLAAVREAADGLPIGLRISADEFLPGGLTPPDMVAVVAQVRRETPLSFLNVSHSAYHGSFSLATQIADMTFGHAPFRRFPALFRRALPGLPVIAVCRLDSLPEAAALLADGSADLVGLARAHIADPHLFGKARAGRQHTVRSCIACNQGCLGRIEAGLDMACVVNPRAGREGIPRPRRGPGRRVLVVGGGPAGLSAAIEAARRGHTVTLVEARPELGGQVRMLSYLDTRRRFALLADELERDARAAGVRIRLGSTATADEVVAAQPDAVVIATGSRPARRPLVAGPPVLDLWQAIGQLREPDAGDGRVVAIFDDHGDWAGASVAEHYAGRGWNVHLVSPAGTFAGRITTYSRLAVVHRFGEFGIRVHPLRRLAPEAAPARGGWRAGLVDVLTGDVEHLDAVHTVVDAGAGHAVDALARELERRLGAGRVHLAGDANAPRSVLEAVFEGHTCAESLDEPPAAADTSRQER
ncbi:FAD-dependent oxidoreductase [Dactylosporangium sp. CA-092794]|uniref:FAD-dependent oxidoreductase n=1 Tax=Dactylosporangium sp. CA-092794 TaxID=3239929 RepID=UPI003D8F0C9A